MTAPRERPKGFAEAFVQGGWDEVRFAYGASSRQVRRWISECGGPALKADRAQYWRQNRGQR